MREQLLVYNQPPPKPDAAPTGAAAGALSRLPAAAAAAAEEDDGCLRVELDLPPQPRCAPRSCARGGASSGAAAANGTGPAPLIVGASGGWRRVCDVCGACIFNIYLCADANQDERRAAAAPPSCATNPTLARAEKVSRAFEVRSV